MAKPRSTADTAHLQTDYSALLELYQQKPEVDIEVVLGTRCAIVLPPSGHPDQERLNECRNFVSSWLGEMPSAIPLSPRVKNALTPEELGDLDKGLPVVVHFSRMRHLVPGKQGRPNQTPLANRINDARQLMVTESLLHLGHLSKRDPTSIEGTNAFDAAVYKFIENDWPAEIRQPATDDERYAYLKSNYKEGTHARIGNKFFANSGGTIERVAQHYANWSYSPDERRQCIRYWKTILRSAIAVDGLAEAQKSSLQRMMNTPDDKLEHKQEVMKYIGVIGATAWRPDFDTVLPIALYDVEDIGEVMRWVSIGKEYYRCAAIIGEITRGRRARISPIQARFLDTIVCDFTVKPNGPYMDHRELLQHMMMKHQTPAWWHRGLTSQMFDNAGFRYLSLEDPHETDAVSHSQEDANVRIEDFLSRRGFDILKHASKTHCPIGLVDVQSEQLHRRDDAGKFAVFLPPHFRWGEHRQEWVEDSITRCVAQILIERAADRIVDLRATNPFVWEDTISIATATKVIIQEFGGTPLTVHDIDIAACARQLSDLEVEQAIALGSLAANEFIQAR